MIQSMTGYAALSAESPRGRLSLELRSVNARFLDLQFRVAEELRALEPLLREAITGRVSRGKLDCRFFFNESGGVQLAQKLDAAALARLKALSDEARKAFPAAGELRISDVLRWPGVTAEPQAVAAYRAKLTERLQDVLGSADDERIRTEIAVFAAKNDVDEELERLAVHLAEVDRVLKQGGAAGKRLDFIAQELNREANTLASKAASQPIADCALELKLLIEQVREQVQNIE